MMTRRPLAATPQLGTCDRDASAAYLVGKKRGLHHHGQHIRPVRLQGWVDAHIAVAKLLTKDLAIFLRRVARVVAAGELHKCLQKKNAHRERS